MQAQDVLVNLFQPLEVRAHVRKRDIFNNNSLYYLEKHNCYRLMETKVMDRIMQEYWKSDIDTTGNFLGISTSF